jgi:hypothetical protein
MPRELVWTTRPRQRLTGDLRIDAQYQRDYTPEQMRRWAHDVEQLRTLPQGELQHWLSVPREERTGDQNRLLDSSLRFLDPNEGIKGDLRADGIVELQGGCHRAAYLMEQGVDPVPVWVSSRDSARLTALRQQCEREVAARERAEAHLRSGRKVTPAGQVLWERQSPDQAISREARTFWGRESDPDRQIETRER